MKKFLINTLSISILLLMILASFCSFSAIRKRNMSWKLPTEKHILFMGASHIEQGIDDSRTKEAINLANSSERYMFTYIKLQHLFAENSQIDTVFLQCAPTDLWENTDDKYHVLNEQSYYVRAYWPLYNWEQCRIYKEEVKQVCGLILSNIISRDNFDMHSYWEHLGGFDKKEGKIAEMDRNKVQPKLATGYSGHYVNYDYCRRIINLCKSKGVKLYFVYCPVYHPEYFYDQKYYYDAYKRYFSDVELLDYSHMPIADNLRSDAHHLNNRGAVVFTDSLKRQFNIK